MPDEEAQPVRCTRESIHDVIIDLRPASETFARSFGIRQDAVQRNMLYVPEGFAHAFLIPADETEVFYQMPQF